MVAVADTDSRLSDTEARIMRRVTWRLIPFLILCYFVAYLDRVNLSFASLEMNADLGITPSQYGLGAGLFFLTYFLCEIPSNLLLQRFGATRWIARIMVSWGLCAMGMAFIDGPTSFYIVRLLLGAAEAGFYPGVLFFLTLWFPVAYRSRMLGMFIAAIPISGILGSPLSGALLGLDGWFGLHGWQWLYIIEALPALMLAPFVVLVLQDSPAQARWLDAPDRDWLMARLNNERKEIEAKRKYSVVQTLTNPWVLFLAATYFTNVCLLNGITFFLPQIVKGFGLTNLETGFVVALPSLLALVGLIWWGRRSDAHGERYGHAAFANALGGAALLVAMLVDNPVAKVAAMSLAFACTLAFTAPFWAIPGSFLTGAAAAGGIGAISALGVSGGFLAPWIVGQLHDVTGDFRIPLGLFACIAMAMSIPFYFVGSRRARALAIAAAA
jgi:MFS family permease